MASESDRTDAGSCQAPSGSIATCRAPSSRASHSRKGLDGWYATRVRMPGTLSASKGGRPVNSRYATEPSENRSVRASTERPRACSGDMNIGVPKNWPVDVSWTASSLAMPKSMIFGSPESWIMMFAGLMSRCTTPCACA